jgi:hypothetical protein
VKTCAIVRARGGHHDTSLALETADSTFAVLSAYFDGWRMKRDSCEYDFAGGISDTDADGLLKRAPQFNVDAEA